MPQDWGVKLHTCMLCCTLQQNKRLTIFVAHITEEQHTLSAQDMQTTAGLGIYHCGEEKESMLYK